MVFSVYDKELRNGRKMEFMKKVLHHRFLPAILIVFAAFVFIIPAIISKSMIVGSDGMFHFNRFYETAMQIKTGNINYYLSLFSFQQSGRIVNVFYGPLVAYFNGLLVLIAGNWFRYQLLSNFFIYVVSGLSMYLLLRTNKVRKEYSLAIGLIYMTTYAIQYWTIRQGFTSWGASFLPLCLIPLRRMVVDRDIHYLQLALCMAFMVQTHVFSSLLLAGIYVPFFLYALVKTEDKPKLLKKLFGAIGLFFVLTANIWVNYLDLYSVNDILPPFVNRTMEVNTINQNSSYWLYNPALLVGLMLFQLIYVIKGWRRFSTVNRLVTATSVFFLVCSTSLIPWQFLLKHEVPFVSLIQFPFRFFVPYTVLLLVSFGLTLEEQGLTAKKAKPYLRLGVVASLVQAFVLISVSLSTWQEVNVKDLSTRHTLFMADSNQVKASFFESDMSKSLSYWQKSTPDYLPIQGKVHGNKYDAYERWIIEPNTEFKKTVQNDQLLVEWIGTEEKEVAVPIVKYQQTALSQDGQELPESAYSLSEMGTVLFKQKIGENKLLVSYKAPVYVRLALLIATLAWVVVFGGLGYWLVKRLRIHH